MSANGMAIKSGLGTSARWKYLRTTLVAYAFLLPAATILVVFHFYPVLRSLWVSLLEWNMISTPEYIGFENYRRLIEDEEFRQAIFNTVYYVAGSVPLTITLALTLAVLLNNKIKGVGLYRLVYFLPYITAMNAVAIVWYYIFHPHSGGLLNELLGVFGIPKQQWLINPVTAMPSVIILSVWKVIGYNAVIFLAGLQNISNEYYEAAAIDGATGWSRFRHITWPLLSPTTYFVLIVSIIGSFQVFAPIYIMTLGGPAGATTVVVYYLYDIAFGLWEFGYASAMAYVLFAVIFALTLIQRRYIGSRVHYQ